MLVVLSHSAEVSPPQSGQSFRVLIGTQRLWGWTAVLELLGDFRCPGLRTAVQSGTNAVNLFQHGVQLSLECFIREVMLRVSKGPVLKKREKPLFWPRHLS